jgi:predicted NUDIX family phosphoesterase/thymidylate kinase
MAQRTAKNSYKSLPGNGGGVAAVTLDRQRRAEQLAARFREVGRKPIVVEFAGVPKAGKTTTLGQLHAFLKRCGFRVETVVERASVCPIRDKKHSNFNVWTACTTLAQLLEKTQIPPRADDPDILILDRGIFDSLCWLRMMEQLSRLKKTDLDAIDSFLRLDDWRKRISAVFVMTASPEDSLERERGYLPVEGAKGSVMNAEVLKKTLATTQQTAERLASEFRLFVIDTSSEEFRGNPQRSAEKVADLTLQVIDEQLQEEILFLPREKLVPLFAGATSIVSEKAAGVIECFARHGEYQPRDKVEARTESVQALPVVVVRNKTGEVLRLRRKEESGANPLHQKLVIWAGGHVRVEDGTNGEAVLHCAVRELHEELRLSVETSELKLLGSIYIPQGERASKHVAIVYEWRAESDDVAVALSNAEFFERRGNSLSGSFVPLDALVSELVSRSKKNRAKTEIWSQEIIREFLAPDSKVIPPRLF